MLLNYVSVHLKVGTPFQCVLLYCWFLLVRGWTSNSSLTGNYMLMFSKLYFLHSHSLNRSTDHIYIYTALKETCQRFTILKATLGLAALKVVKTCSHIILVILKNLWHPLILWCSQHAIWKSQEHLHMFKYN